MERIILKHVKRLLAVGLACAAPVAFGQVDEKCMAQWNDAVAAEAVGSVCKVGDPASMAGLKAAEDTALNCAAAKMTPDAAADFRANAAKTKAAIAKQMAGEACPAQAKSFYQQSATKIAPQSKVR
jgi:hypothetical protein